MSVFWLITAVTLGGTVLFILGYALLAKKYYWGPAGKPPPRKPRAKE
ncbi:MAG: hypothetical protein ABIP75_13690 [Pyrinomonadaceae bacterium]